MVDALSRKARLAITVVVKDEMLEEVVKWGMDTVGEKVICASIQARSLLAERIKESQMKNTTLKNRIELAQ